MGFFDCAAAAAAFAFSSSLVVGFVGSLNMSSSISVRALLIAAAAGEKGASTERMLEFNDELNRWGVWPVDVLAIDCDCVFRRGDRNEAFITAKSSSGRTPSAALLITSLDLVIAVAAAMRTSAFGVEGALLLLLINESSRAFPPP